MTRSEIDWEIHVVNDRSQGSGQEKEFLPGMCDAHTHGLEKYGSKELQFVLDYPQEQIGYILNTVGKMIQSGTIYKDGDLIEGITGDGAKLKVVETMDCFGKPILRLIMPDGAFRYPEDSEEEPYNWQIIGPYLPKFH